MKKLLEKLQRYVINPVDTEELENEILKDIEDNEEGDFDSLEYKDEDELSEQLSSLNKDLEEEMSFSTSTGVAPTPPLAQVTVNNTPWTAGKTYKAKKHKKKKPDVDEAMDSELMHKYLKWNKAPKYSLRYTSDTLDYYAKQSGIDTFDTYWLEDNETGEVLVKGNKKDIEQYIKSSPKNEKKEHEPETTLYSYILPDGTLHTGEVSFFPTAFGWEFDCEEDKFRHPEWTTFTTKQGIINWFRNEIYSLGAKWIMIGDQEWDIDNPVDKK